MRAVKFAAMIVAGLALAACANKPNQMQRRECAAWPAAPPPGSAQDFVVNVGDRVFFEIRFLRAHRRSRARRSTSRRSGCSQYNRYAFTVEGHADERGTREYNIALGARRAAGGARLSASRGVAANRMRTISYGKERPVAVCNDISCWSQNRRAVTVLNASS